MSKIAMTLGLCLVLATFGNAAPITAYQPGSAVGNQNWSGNLGMDFDVWSPVTIHELGAFGPATGFNDLTSIQVAIFDRVKQAKPVVAGVLTFSKAAPGTFDASSYTWFKQLNTPVLLAPGGYTIVAIGYAYDQNGNVGNGSPLGTTNGGGVLDFVDGSRYDYNTSLGYPRLVDSGPANRYYAGNFKFTAVPEPGTSALLGIGLVGLAMLRRRK